VGQSRGGFIALHVAAADPRIRCVAAFAPVTNLLALGEFQGMEGSEAVNALSLARSADKLAGRPIWGCIGNKDRRVGTDDAIASTRAVVEASVSQGKPALIELRVPPAPIPRNKPQTPEEEKAAQARQWKGHIVHATANRDVADWIAAQLGGDE